ncbi:DnaJ-domain-containing protein [Venturia nashicola]|uniref:DnaJ-domain-containing protein n=1 Tax=Venturia nashicola TaxID=86259 RepID=A0A4Z1P1W2_9PEZI|nr:DnaJ-domain-containing protein [Venturia nashicola]
MGPNQSKNAGANSAPAANVKTSYYELLGIERQATEDEIKKAYRRRALDLHPDRNHGAEEEATIRFAEIQAAYEVLSDPQERAWYDSHESSILRGAEVGGDEEEHFEHNVRVTTADELDAMMGMFRYGVDYSDSPNGFYGFVREVFEKLAREEEIAAEWENLDAPDYPSFGHKDDSYEDVVKHFYAAWGGFATKKAFAWKDKYRLNEAPDRRVRRMMEKENAGFRASAIKEFNEAVRQLVSFVKKRDRRWTPETEDQRHAAARKATAAQAARQRAANAAKMAEEVPEWTKIQSSDEQGDSDEEEEEEEEEEEYECVACRKTFKSEKQWLSHEKSKKHQKSMYALKKQMRKDNAVLGLDEETIDGGDSTPLDEEDYPLQDDEPEEEADPIPEVENLDISDDSENSTTLLGEDKDEEAAPRKSPPVGSQDSSASDSDSQDSDYAPREKVADRLTSSINSFPTPISPPEPSSSEPPLPEKKLGKAAQKRLKKAAKDSNAGSTKGSMDGSTNASSEFQCSNCAAPFSSKTKLFAHLKENPGHAKLIPATGGKGKGKGKKR